jgi:very-short-patch-repair endonuclease
MEGGWVKSSHHPVPVVNRRNARKMRKTMTEAELKLWNELRAHRLMGLSFRRQMPIDGYIVDFACPSQKIIVEVDGSQHADSQRDRTRDEALTSLGWSILRFWNDDVLRDIDSVCQHVVIAAGLGTPDNPLPTPYREEPRP